MSRMWLKLVNRKCVIHTLTTSLSDHDRYIPCASYNISGKMQVYDQFPFMNIYEQVGPEKQFLYTIARSHEKKFQIITVTSTQCFGLRLESLFAVTADTNFFSPCGWR